jgi:hypothetical protein
VAIGLAWVLAGCDSTIHKEANIGGIDTLSVDAKQRLMVVGDRYVYKHGQLAEPVRRITCTEPMPDALVARAAALAGNVNVNVQGQGSGGGGFSGGSSEAAASIGFRDSTIQMLRDGYFQLCEVYMNGAISKTDFEHMALNVDTFMAVVSALQILGTNQTAPAVVISASKTTAKSNVKLPSDADTDAAAEADSPAPPEEAAPKAATVAVASSDKTDAAVRARVVRNIVHAYLRYRHDMELRALAEARRR